MKKTQKPALAAACLFSAPSILMAPALAGPTPVPNPITSADWTLPSLQVPLAKVTPKVDGDPLDPAWASAAITAPLTPSFLEYGTEPAAPHTQVKVLWDPDFLYVRFECAATEIYAPYTQHDDPIYKGDAAEVFLDPVGDGRLYYELQSSPNGAIFDQYIAVTAEPRVNQFGMLVGEVASRDFWPNLSWNCDGLKVTGKVQYQGQTVTGWIADFAIPAKQILRRAGKTAFEAGTLRANFLRYEWPAVLPDGKRDLAALNWSTVVRGCPHISAARMGFLQLQG